LFDAPIECRNQAMAEIRDLAHRPLSIHWEDATHDIANGASCFPPPGELPLSQVHTLLARQAMVLGGHFSLKHVATEACD
jgi:hypothetical protein